MSLKRSGFSARMIHRYSCLPSTKLCDVVSKVSRKRLKDC